MRFFSIFSVFAIGAVMFISSATAGDMKMNESTDISVTGRVVDPACYIKAGMKGADHRVCAQACAKAGQAFGILDEINGVLYQVLATGMMKDPNEGLMDHAEEIVTVEGKLFEKDGMKGIVPTKVKKGS